MSRRWQAQSPDGIMQEIPGVGIMSNWSTTTTPTNAANPAGYAPGCQWFYVPVSGPPRVFQNIGGNGMYIGGTQNTVANWIETDPTSYGQLGFGLRTGSMFMSPDGLLYETILGAATGSTPAGISPSAAGALKIVDVFTLGANVFDQVGRMLEFEVFCTVTTASGLNQQIQIVAAPTNVITWPANPSTTTYATNAGIAGQTDGTVTVSGGTAILDTGSVSMNTSSAAAGFTMKGLLACSVVGSAQQSMVLNIFGGTAGCGPWTDRTLTTTAAVTFVVCVSTQTTATNLVYNGCRIRGVN